MWRDRIGLALWLGLAAAAFALTFQFSDELGAYKWGASSWPRVVIVVLAISALLHYRFRDQAPAKADKESEERLTREEVLRAFGILAIPLVYVAFLPYAGFYAATPFFLLAILWRLGERRPHVLAGVVALLYFLVNLVFTKLFYVALPTGTWPGFYDFSNWLLVALG